ncbi:hypothetical protein [Haloarcula sp. JP-L23]|uniref:DUF7289 family protein n=1 Tax=Haloarcula sp. JP-L23 TaxID=2716717 RepID=UPI00140EFAF7|nr:hypothetical protein G9465_14930 [Haloarcula sp. JP-L23]
MSDRAVSEVLSFTLVFTLIVASIALISVGGLGSLQDVRDVEQLESAERAFDVLADNVADIHQRGAPSRATEISLGESQLRTGDNVTMRVELEGGGGLPQDFEWDIRPIVYEGNDDRRIVYEAGAVFRTNRDGGVVVREPPLVVDEKRMLVTVVGVNRPNVQSLSGSTVLVRMNHRGSNVFYRNRSADVDSVQITMSSTPRASLWAEVYSRYGFSCTLPSQTSVECTYNPGNIDRVYVVYHDVRVNIDK